MEASAGAPWGITAPRRVRDTQRYSRTWREGEGTYVVSEFYPSLHLMDSCILNDDKKEEEELG